MKLNYIFYLALFIGLTFTSCRKDQDEVIDENPIYQPKIKVEGSVFGIVTDMDKKPVEDAVVTYDGKSITTDIHGVFRFEDETLYEDGTFITVEKDGYFKGSRRFYPRLGKQSRVGIELMPLTIIDQIEANASAKVKFEAVELDFAANSVVTESGAAYSGMVNIAARYLDPTQIATLNQMPGDLAGFNTEEEVVSLTSLGMIAVELMDDDGNELQLKEGSPVSAIIPIPSELLATAPTTIPLWHFDEEMGIWVEEGEATKVGDHYEGVLPHFSFWNCDYPGELIDLSGIILNRGVSVGGIQIRITTATGSVSSGYTDEDGFYGGKVPANTDLTIEIINACGEVIYTTTIGALSEDTVLDPINVNSFVQMLNISGSVEGCDGADVSNLAYVVVSVGEIQSIINLEDDNTFSGVSMYCDGTAEVSISAYDALNFTSSAVSTYTISGDIEVGALILCEDSYSTQFVYQYGDKVLSIGDEGTAPDSTIIYTYDMTTNGNQLSFTFTLLDWATDLAVDCLFTYEEGTTEGEAIFAVINEGFTASGIGSSQLVTDDGIEYYVFRGVLSDIDITNPDIYNPDHTELEYSIVIPK